MKSLFLTIATLFLSTSIFAQFSDGNRTIGAYLIHCGYEDDDDHHIETSGIGIKYQYYINEKWVIEPSASFIFPQKENGINVRFSFELSGNVQYRFTLFDKFQVYPLAGLSVVRHKATIKHYEEVPYESKESSTELTLNIGGGAAYQLSPEWQVNAEVKYQTLDFWDREVYCLGIDYLF